MSVRGFRWFELFPPRGLDLPAVTAFVRPLASRPLVGVLRRTPPVVVEQWQLGGATRSLLGVGAPLGEGFVRQLAAAVPGLVVRPAEPGLRRPLLLASDVRLASLAAVLRTDVAVQVSSAVGAAFQATGQDDALVMQWVIGPSQGRRRAPTTPGLAEQLGLRPVREPSAHDRSLWRHKASEPLFAVRGRLGTSGRSGLLDGLGRALRLADSASGHLRIDRPTPGTARALGRVAYQGWTGIVSAGELATLLGWPLDDAHGRALPIGDVPPVAPASMADGRELGLARHPAAAGQVVPLPAAALTRHVHVIGPTGSGKSTLLTRMALDDIAAGRPLVLIEPKGDLCDAVMERLTPSVRERVVVIEGGDTAWPVGSNPLAGEPGTVERRSDEIVGVFRDLHGTALGPRSTDVLLHALRIAATIPGGSLPDVPALLDNPGFRRWAAGHINDPLVLSPWLAWFDSLSDGERAQVVAPIMNKLRGFTSRASIRRLLGQPDPGWSWDSVLNGSDSSGDSDAGSPSIVLASLNRGVIGPEAATVLGALLFGQLWAAIQRRTRLPEARRRTAAVIVDEWQLFAGSLDFADVLATARGMGVSVTAAHQHLAQLTPGMRAAVRANMRSRIVFTPAHDDAAPLAALVNTSTVTVDDLLRLPLHDVVAVMHDTPGAVHVTTQPPPPPLVSADSVRRASQQRYGRDGNDIDAALLKRWAGARPSGAIGVLPGGTV